MGRQHADRPGRRAPNAAQESSLGRRQLLTASFITAAASTAAVSAFSAKVFGKAKSSDPAQQSADSTSDELTAHRRDYYNRARF